ncbi:hypothetical protein B0O99DRAFT_622866 [Bisporella sp. PMI_857]|nr:hypothetical protein B0O99DRAFT_622866 [Bisporella sp. PMI_857]
MSATEPCDYVTSVWVDCPGYTLPEEYKQMPLPDLLDNAVRQFETNYKMSIMATAISALFEDHSSEPALLWRPNGQLGDRKITSVSDLYRTIVHNCGLIPIGVVGHPQYILTQRGVPLSKSALDYTEQFSGKSEKEVFKALRPVFEKIAPMSKAKATTQLLPELEQAMVGDKFKVMRKNQMLPLQWMLGNTSNTDLPADHHEAVYKLVTSVLGLDVGACKARKLSLMVSLDPGHPCIGLRKQVLKRETNACTHVTISTTPNGWEDGGRRYHFLLEGYKEDEEAKAYHITGIWVPHCWDEGSRSGAAISG